jgi:hypothetical protein
MSTIRDRSRVELAISIEPALLTGDALAPVRNAYAAFRTAEDIVIATHDAWEDAKNAASVRDAEIREATRAKKKTIPAPISEAQADEMERMARAEHMDALRAAKRLGNAYEAAVLEHRLAIRAAVLAPVREVNTETIEQQRQTDAANARRDVLLHTLAALDHFAAKAEDAAQAERTSRFEHAYFEARRRLFAEYHRGAEGRSPLAALMEFPVDALEVDVLQEDEFLAARKGEGHVRAIRGTEAELRAWRNGDYTGTFEAQRRRIIELEARLKRLRSS